MEPDRDAGPLAFHGGDAQALTHRFEGGVLQKVFHGGRRCAEAVFEFLSNVQLIGFGGDRGDALVGTQPEIFAGDVVLRDSNVKAKAEGGTEVQRDYFAFEFWNG